MMVCLCLLLMQAACIQGRAGAVPAAHADSSQRQQAGPAPGRHYTQGTGRSGEQSCVLALAAQ
jgi:hypothetical protein